MLRFLKECRLGRTEFIARRLRNPKIGRCRLIQVFFLMATRESLFVRGPFPTIKWPWVKSDWVGSRIDMNLKIIIIIIICLHTVIWYWIFLLNDNFQNRSFLALHEILTDTITPDQNGPRSNRYEDVLHHPAQTSRSGASITKCISSIPLFVVGGDLTPS